ncbi:MAG TPA: histone deacetylase [Oceanipulchritudo sp.]|nr:histone deacetylase [Oceanipulchritudo sp.]
MARPVAVYFHQDCLLHDTGPDHPETAARLTVSRAALLASDFAGLLHWHKPDPVASYWIERVHTPEYRQFIEEACLQGRHFVDAGETTVCQDSYHAALLSAGAAVSAVDAVMQEGYSSAFSLTRPPGHHASEEKAMGFCLFNNVAIAANYAEEKYGLERICIIDWDVHHGNGTQDIFYGSPTILFCSLHQLPLYPHTGEFHEIGTGAGLGLTINCPLPGGAGIDLYHEAWEHDLAPKIREFQPQLFFISAGFDAHRLDPLSDIQLESSDYRSLTEWVMKLAAESAHGRLISLLEGGYHLDALAESIIEHVRVLTKEP